MATLIICDKNLKRENQMLATLSTNKDKETTKLINNLGLEWKNDHLSFHKNKPNVKLLLINKSERKYIQEILRVGINLSHI